MTSGFVTSGDSGGVGEDGSGEVGAAVRGLPRRGGRWQASWEGQVNRKKQNELIVVSINIGIAYMPIGSISLMGRAGEQSNNQ